MASNMERFLVVFVALLVLACSAHPRLDGEWQGDAWGRVAFVGLRGSYTDTYGPDPGEIRLERMPDGSYSGTWGEGEKRHGTLKVRFESRDVIVGEWSADPNSTIHAQSGGIIRWNRTK